MEPPILAPPNPNRIENLTPANAETNARTASISPTGQPMIPAHFAPWLMLLATLGGIPATLLAAGVAVPAVLVAIGSIVGGLAVVLLGGSPGLRRAEPPKP